jgi:transposase
MFAMPIALRTDFDATACLRAAKGSKDGPQARRLLALAAIYDGASRGEAARIGGVTVQIVRDWVVKFNARGPAGLIDRKAPGPTSRLSAEHRKTLAELIETGPNPYIHGVVRWRLIDLCQWVWDRPADDEPGTARHGLSQAFGPSPPSCSGQRGYRRF